jgi:tRNA threonylcarbamoyladenosine biosynthesis protein TsaE
VQTVVRAGELFQDIIAPHHTFSEDETITLGQQFTNSILHQVRELPVIMALEGEMGAGKTQFAKGVARALSIQKVISSPTYTIMKEYEGVDADSGQHITFLHLDCWRLPSATLDELGISVLRPGQIILVEWAAPIIDELKTLKGQAKVYHVYLEAIDHERVISIRSFHEE